MANYQEEHRTRTDKRISKVASHILLRVTTCTFGVEKGCLHHPSLDLLSLLAVAYYLLCIRSYHEQSIESQYIVVVDEAHKV